MKNITFTGVDKQTSLPKLAELTREFPKFNIEWGLLASKTQTANRYMDFGAIEFAMRDYKDLNWALHLCGSCVREFADWYFNRENFITLPAEARLAKLADRVQLNFNWEATADSTQSLIHNLTNSEFYLIAQYNKNNKSFWDSLEPIKSAFSPLVDASGGRGTLIKNFASPKNYLYVGYAGGINAQNCNDVYSACQQVTQGRTNFWLDMESGVRTDDWFDLAKVRAVLESLSHEKS